MIHDQAIHLLSALFALLGLAVIWLWLYRDYRVDFFRQRMFSLRDELFDEGCRGTISFDHPAYGMLRSTMNGFIRFGHKMGILNFIFFVVYLNKEDQKALREVSFDAHWQNATMDLPMGVKDKLFNYKLRMNMLLVEHLLLVSPFVILTVITPVWLVMFVREVVRKLLNKISDRIEYIDSAALALGSKT
jgi:hypothetical protein